MLRGAHHGREELEIDPLAHRTSRSRDSGRSKPQKLRGARVFLRALRIVQGALAFDARLSCAPQ
jgi:hypothetical protein